MNNLNLKNIAESLIDTFLKAGEIAKEISNRGVKIMIKSELLEYQKEIENNILNEIIEEIIIYMNL